MNESPVPPAQPPPPLSGLNPAADDPEVKGAERKALWALILAIAGLVVCGVPLIPALILANQALAVLTRPGIESGSRGIASAARIVAILGIAVLLLSAISAFVWFGRVVGPRPPPVPPPTATPAPMPPPSQPPLRRQPSPPPDTPGPGSVDEDSEVKGAEQKGIGGPILASASFAICTLSATPASIPADRVRRVRDRPDVQPNSPRVASAAKVAAISCPKGP